jgi:hypothetical protein
MRTVFYALLILVALGVAAFFFLAFLLSGGFDRWTAERETAARGYTASIPHAAPGYKRLLLPQSWRRDTYSEIFDRIAEGGASDGRPRETVRLNGPDEAVLHVGLGQFAHAGGTSFSATATIYTRLRNATPWTVAMGANGQSGAHEPAWDAIPAPEGNEAYIVKGSAPQAKGVRVLVNAPARRSRIDLRTTADVYTEQQAVTVAASILASIEIDDAGLDAALESARVKAAAKAEAAKRSIAAMERILGLAAPLAPGINDIGGGSFIWFDDYQLQGNMRLGTMPLNGRTPGETAAGLTIDRKRLDTVVPAAGSQDPDSTVAAEIVSVFVRDGSLVLHSIGLGREVGVVSLDSAVEGRIARSLPADAVAIYRIGNMQVADTPFVERWFGETRLIMQAAGAGPPLWVPK